jgi:hypothetical protein
MSEMTFYIEEIEDGDPEPSPPPDGGESDEDSANGEDNFINLGDLTAQLTDLNSTIIDDEVTPSGDCSGGGSTQTSKKKNKKKKNGKKKANKTQPTIVVDAKQSGGGGDYATGDRVELFGLVGKTELNGTLGSISSSGIMPSGRYSVLLDDGCGPFDLKPTNLKLTNKLPNSQWLLKPKKVVALNTNNNNSNSSGSNKNSSSKLNVCPPTGRGGASATLIDGTSNGGGLKLCIFGGANRQGVHNSDLFILSTSISSSTEVAAAGKATEAETESFNDVWQWNKCTNVTGTVPKPRSGHSAVLCSDNKDAKIKKLVVFGGSDLSSGVMYDDLYHLNIHDDTSDNSDVGGVEFVPIQTNEKEARGGGGGGGGGVSSGRPLARNAHTATMIQFGDGREVMVLFGGTTSDGPTNDIYILDNPSKSLMMMY